MSWTDYSASVAVFVFLAIFCASGCQTSRGPGGIPAEQPAKSRDSYQVNGQWYHPITDSASFRQRGRASWYGDPFHGRKTASGERYDMHARTAAHKTLPIGTFLRVRRLDNGKETIVRVNDRGPFVHGRIIDLSYKAARDIEMIGPGTARVEILAMEKAFAAAGEGEAGHGDFFTGDFTVQVGAFNQLALAESLRDELPPGYAHVCIIPVSKGAETFYRVQVGRFTSLASAKEAVSGLVRRGYKSAFAVVRNDTDSGKIKCASD